MNIALESGLKHQRGLHGEDSELFSVTKRKQRYAHLCSKSSPLRSEMPADGSPILGLRLDSYQHPGHKHVTQRGHREQATQRRRPLQQ